MNCPKCGNQLPDNINVQMSFCPMCGDRLYEAGKRYLVQIQSIYNNDNNEKMRVSVDDRELYEANPRETICLALNAGFHILKFKHKIRSKVITLLVASNYVIAATFNSLSGLIETNIRQIPETESGISTEDLASVELTQPVMVSGEGDPSLDAMTGDDDPAYIFKVTSGLKEGLLRLYEKRLEFATAKDLKKEVIKYDDIVAVRPKMGSIDVQCEGNVHKVYSIPKESYNEVMAFLTNRIGREE